MATEVIVGKKAGYWVLQWATQWDPSLNDLANAAPHLVIGNFIVITSCDSGLYKPSEEELAIGWRAEAFATTIPRIGRPDELPAPGFDEWYVFDHAPISIPDRNHVNRFGFSVLADDEDSRSFWSQVEATQPIHALGCGTPNMFVVTRDETVVNSLRDVCFSS